MTSIFTRDKEKTCRREGHWEWGRDGSDGDTEIAHNHWKPEEVRKPSPFEPPLPKGVQPSLTPRFWSSGSGNVRNYNSVVLSHPVCLIQRRQWQPRPVLLPGDSHGWRNLVGCSPWGRKELDMTERFHFHFSLSCIGEGNGHPLQCSCLENPRDRGAWWAAGYGVAQSPTRLKWLSSSSS